MATQASLIAVQKMYIAYYGRPADNAGLNAWADALDAANGDMSAIVEAFGTSPEATARFGGKSSAETITTLYQQLFGRDPETQEVLDEWVNQLENNPDVTLQSIALDLLNGAQNDDLAAVNNKLSIAQSFSAAIDTADETNAYVGQAAIDAGTALLDGVTATTDVNTVDVDAALAALVTTNPGGGNDGATFTLTESQDNLVGDADNNTFNAYVFDNQNTLQSGDMVDGGAGLDTLKAVVGNSQAFAMTPVTQNVEIVEIRAQAAAFDNADNEVVDGGTESVDKNAQIDAQDMSGVQEWWSVDSRANLVIEDVRSNSHQTKIGARNTDPGNVNLEVYFSPENITANDGTTSGSQVFLDLLDQLHAPDAPLQQHPYKTFSFTFQGTTYTIDNLEAPNSYVELETLVRDQIADLGLTASLEVTRIPNGFQDNNGVQGDRIVISSKEGTDVSVPASGSFTTGDSKNSDGSTVDDVYFALNDQAGTQTPALTSADIELDNVGRGSKSGDVIVGNMSMLGAGTVSGSDGIQQFNVEVDRNSWINELRSTGDQASSSDLEVVNVVNIAQNNAAGDGDLQIDVLRDVRVFDAATMDGDVKLNASLSAAVTDKYLNLTDTAVDGSADNSENSYRDVTDTFFSYDMGNGNDVLSLSLSEANLADAGNASREDFVLEVNGGAGDDELNVFINDEDGSGNNSNDFWFANHQENADIVVNGGAGDDTIRTFGQGDMDINAGSGDDTLYTDNAGNASVWVVNASNTDVNNLNSNGVGTTGMLSNATLTVTYAAAHGMTVGDAARNTQGIENSVVITTNATGNQATVNQAIKRAINEDEVLSKLLKVEDGPAHTLVITSLIDGSNVTNDLHFEVQAASVAAMADTQKAALKDAYEELTKNSNADLTDAQLQTVLTDAANAYDGNNAVLAATGSDSVYESNNVINVGAGSNDIVVLSTGANSNETIEFTGTGLGKVTLVNFDDDPATAGTDTLDFSAYLTGMTSASSSTVSQVAVPASYEFVNVATSSATASANEILVINDFAGDADSGETWSAMTGSSLLAAIRDDNTTGYGNIANGDINVAAKVADYVGNTVKNIIMVENDANQGEYKVFEVTSDLSAGVNEFTAATLITTIDFGASFNQAANTGNTGGGTNPGGNTTVTPDAGTGIATATDGSNDTVTFSAAELDDGNWTVNGFNTAEDVLSLAGLVGATGSTLADLDGQTIDTGVIGVQVNQIDQSIFVNLGNDATPAADVISIEINGVTDASLVDIALV